MNRWIYAVIIVLDFAISFNLESYATSRFPFLMRRAINSDERRSASPPSSFQSSYASLPPSKTDVSPTITLTSGENAKQQLIPPPKKTHPPIVKDIPPTISNLSPRCTPLPPPTIEATSSPLSTLCFYENCLDDPYEDIFLPTLPPKVDTPSAARNLLPSLKPQEPITSMIEVEHSLSTSYIIIDGNRHPHFGYNLLSDILNVFRDFNLEDVGTNRPPCLTPSLRARNLSSRDTLSLFTALDTLLAEREEVKLGAAPATTERRIVAIYLYNVEIDVNSAQILKGILEQDKYLQNLWLEYCKIDEEAKNVILEGIMPSHLLSFWLLDDETDFRLPPSW